MTMTDEQTEAPTDAAGLRAEYSRQGYDRLSDTELAARVAAQLCVPRQDPADSFVLHAPLELAARVALLPHVRPERREAARLRLLALMTRYVASGPPIQAAPSPANFDTVEQAADRLVAAIDRGELDEVDTTARWLGRAATPAQLQRLLAGPAAARLAAAGHAPIFLYHLPRIAPRGEVTGELLRGLARELGRYPDWRLQWIDDRPAGSSAPAEELFDAVAAVVRAGPPESSFIFPIMSTVDGNGVAAGTLADVTVGTHLGERGRALLRAAAWSMLLEPDDHAAYGWSHCLTMPQAVIGTAGALPDPSLALAVAATHVVGFRAALAQVALVPSRPSDPGPIAVADALHGGRSLAAAAVWHAPESALPGVAGELATMASTAHDAHLVKYTLACLDAAAADPSHRRLFLASAASLTAWWIAHGDPDDSFRDL